MRPRVRSDDLARDLGELYGRSLTRRQTEVLLLVMAGHTYLNDIARKLTISRSATAGHISTIYAKTGANNLTELNPPQALFIQSGVRRVFQSYLHLC
jgi:DNA-binding CsgD family transcriptional regulator